MYNYIEGNINGVNSLSWKNCKSIQVCEKMTDLLVLTSLNLMEYEKENIGYLFSGPIYKWDFQKCAVPLNKIEQHVFDTDAGKQLS